MSGTLNPTTTGEQLKVLPAASWTVERKFRFDDDNPSTAPFSVLLLDRQFYVAAGACFVRHVRQIHNEAATVKLDQVNIPFAPHRESITIHWMRIWRGGQAIEQIDSESDLELRDGNSPNRLVVHHALKDLRPGDALDIAYSTKAITPRRRFSTSLLIRQRVPILDWHLSAIAPKDSPVESKCQQQELQPVARQLSEGSHFLHWSLSDVPPLTVVTNLPSWHQPNPEIQLSNFGSWTEVAADIYRRWRIQAACEQTVALANSFAEGSDSDAEPWEAARRACRFVQDEITTTAARALTLAPAAPCAETLDLRQGDPRAKACLLVNLLRSLGVPSAPILVSKARKRSIGTALPAPELFDHVIVRGRIGDTDFWIDPCATHQAGPIQSTSLPAFHLGLQLSTRTTSLCAIPKPDPLANQLAVTEHFVAGIDRNATLKVTTRASGTEANMIRATIADTSLEEFSAARLTDLQTRHADAERTEQLSLQDDPDTNEIVLEEQFDIPNVFASSRDGAVFLPSTICKNLPASLDSSTARDHPWALGFPCNIRHLTVIDTPWEVEDGETSDRLPGTAFAFSFKGTTKGRRHTLRYAYNSLDDHIVPVDFASARLRLDSIRPLVRYIFEPPSPDGRRPKNSAKGKRIVTEKPSSATRERKSNPHTSGSILKPIIGLAGAACLFYLVKSNFQSKASANREAILVEQLAKKAAEPPPEKKPATGIPDNPLAYLPPLAPLPGPEKLDELDVKFDIGDGTPRPEEKASEKKNVTSDEYKLSN